MNPKFRLLKKFATVHEDSVRLYGPIDDDDVLRDVHAAAANYRRKAEKVIEAAKAIRANQMQTEIANERQLREVSTKVFQQATKSHDAAIRRVKETVAKIDQETSAPSKPPDAVSALVEIEIGKAIGRMSESERDAIVSSAIGKNDDVTLSAVLNLPSVITGITQEEIELRRASFRLKRFPSEIKRMNGLRTALSDLDRIGRIVRKFVLDLTDDTKISAAAESEAAAREAIQAVIDQ